MELTRSLIRIGVWAAAAGAMAGCLSTADGQLTAPTRPASKTTCVGSVPGELPDDLVLSWRRLIPLSARVLGPEVRYAGTGRRRLTIRSGGQLAEFLDAYDELGKGRPAEITGVEGEVYTGSFLGDPVHAAIWQDSDQPPCGVRAMVATALDADEFTTVLAGITRLRTDD